MAAHNPEINWETGEIKITRCLSIRIANSKAGIKPTAPLSAFDKENSIEFLLDFLHYLYKWLTLTLYQSPALPYESLLSHVSIDKKIKGKKKKRILNNDLAVFAKL